METKIGFKPMHTGVLVEWKAEEKAGTGIILVGAAKQAKTLQDNGISKIVAVGSNCSDTTQVGKWALLNGTGRLINVNGKVYGLVKEHQIDGVYDEMPSGEMIELEERNQSQQVEGGGEINLSKTIDNLERVVEKHGNKLKGF